MTATNALQSVVNIGTFLAGRFVVEQSPLGNPGTAGFACLAKDSFTAELVVCKVPRTLEPTYVDLLKSQYHQLRRIRSQSVVRAYALFEHVLDDQVMPFIVLEFVEGDDLATWARSRSKRERIKALIQVCDGLASLEDVGMQHGDLHAENVIVTKLSEVVLIDPESETWGRSRPSQARPGVDQGALKSLIAEILPDVTLSSTLQQLDAKYSARDLAQTLRRVATLRQLPGEIDPSLDGMAVRIRDDAEARKQIYKRLVKARETAIRMLDDRLAAGAHALQLKITENLNNTDTTASDPQRGILEGRHLRYQTIDNDYFEIAFGVRQGFRLPWPFPDKQGLVDRGVYSVIRDGKVVVSDELSIWWNPESETAALITDSAARQLTIDWHNRCFGILVGEVLPGIRQPVPTSGKKSAPVSLGLFLTHDDRQKVLTTHADSAAHRDGSGDEKETNEGSGDTFQAWEAQLKAARQREQVADCEAVRQFLTGWRFHKSTKTGHLTEFFRKPQHARSELVQVVAADLVKFVDPYVRETRKMDVRVKDASTKTLEVVVELVLRGDTSSVVWPLEVRCS